MNCCEINQSLNRSGGVCVSKLPMTVFCQKAGVQVHTTCSEARSVCPSRHQGDESCLADHHHQLWPPTAAPVTPVSFLQFWLFSTALVVYGKPSIKKAFFWKRFIKEGGGHSGPEGRQINLSKWTKNASKCNNITLTIVFHRNGFNFNVGFKKS